MIQMLIQQFLLHLAQLLSGDLKSTYHFLTLPLVLWGQHTFEPIIHTGLILSLHTFTFKDIKQNLKIFQIWTLND